MNSKKTKYNTEQKIKAKNEFEKQFYKWGYNFFYEKSRKIKKTYLFIW